VNAAPTSSGATPPVAEWRRLVPGLAACALLAVAALLLADHPWLKDTLHVSALLLVILLGMLVGSLVHLPPMFEPGIRLAQRPLLRWAVAGLGFRLSLGELVRIGVPALGVVVISTFAALFFGWWVSRRLGLPEKMGLLLGVGGAICGASAVVAADSVVQGEKRDSALSLGIITLLGTIGIVVYPWLAVALGMSDFFFGVWDGATLHEMAQVVAAGFGVSDEAARVATVVKLARIALLAPVVLYLGWMLRRRHAAAGTAHVSPAPWFLAAFVIFTAINSLGVIPKEWVARIQRADLWLLCIGMAGVGLQTRFGELRAAGVKPLLAGAAQWLFLATVAYGLARVFVR
jgi:uncharacterized integral membrane protein (TIGR00698 family)